jgi:Leucine rich repeat
MEGGWLATPEKILACAARNVEYTEKGIEITSVDGSFDPTSLIAFYFPTSSDVHYVPRGLGTFFPDLQHIWFWHNGLKAIEKSDLEQFKNLKEIFLAGNWIQHLDSDLFVFNTKLTHIDLSYNPLVQVGENLLLPLVNLQEATFAHSNCVNKVASSSSEVDDLINELRTKCKGQPEQIKGKMVLNSKKKQNNPHASLLQDFVLNEIKNKN